MTIFAVTALQGCYSYTPLETASVPIGETVELQVSDLGRVELSERLGRGVSTIEGRVTGTEGDQYLLDVFGISYLNGDHSKWSGESMRLDRGFVERASSRRLSKGRTWAAAGIAAVVVGTFIATQGLAGFAWGGRDKPEPPPPTSLLPGLIVNF